MNKKVNSFWTKLKLLHWLASKEFLALFYCRNNCTDRWDFFRLIILLSLTMTLALFALGTKEGLLNNFTEVLLGKVPNQGIPVWMNSNMGFSHIDSDALASFPNFFPYDNVKPSRLRLPGCSELENIELNSSPACKLWKNGKEDKKNSNTTQNVPVFSGIALFSDDPLWNYSHPNNNDKQNSLSIVLSRYQFETESFFDFDLYLQEMKKRLPKKYAEQLPSKEEFFSKEYSGNIWLSLGIDTDARLLTPMQVRWVNRIPIPGKYAFFISMDLYQSLVFTHNDSSLLSDYYAEIPYKSYISKLTVFSRELISDKSINTLTQCLQNPNVKNLIKNENDIDFIGSGSATYTLKPAKTKNWVEACLQEIELENICPKGQAPGYIPKHSCYQLVYINKDTYPSITYSRKKDGGYTINIRDNKGVHTKNLFGFREQFNQGFTYVKNSGEVFDIVNRIENIENSPFYFNKTYKDSLNRFDTLRDTLDMLGATYGKIVMIFIASLLFIQFLIVVGHRKRNYYIYITQGFKYLDIGIILCFQAIWTSIIAVLFSIIILWCFSSLISNAAIDIFENHKDILIDSDSNLLILDIFDYIYVSFLSSVFSIFICILLIITMNDNWNFMTLKLRLRNYLLNFRKK